MLEPPKIAHCGACAYFVLGVEARTKWLMPSAEGTCRRYPQGDPKSAKYWCGEFADKALSYGGRGVYMFPTQA
jgi:hypothetical protein